MRQIFGAIAEYEKTRVVIKLRATRQRKIWSGVILEVDRNEWERARSRIGESDLDAFVVFQNVANSKGRSHTCWPVQCP